MAHDAKDYLGIEGTMKGRLLSSGRQARIGQRASKKQELSVADELEGSRVPGSGNQWHSKGDVQSDKFLVECKHTDSRQFILKLEVLQKIQLEALARRKKALLVVEFGEKRFAIVAMEDL